MITQVINKNLKDAILNKNQMRLSAFRMLKTKISNFEKKDGVIADDSNIIKIVDKLKAEVLQTISFTSDSSKLEELNQEIDIYQELINDFAPKQLEYKDLEKIIFDLKNSGLNIGGVMSSLKSNYDGMYNGKDASTIFKNS